jgi:uncharacterized NAD(P)/FAD-binding protein YdhS
MAQDPEIRCNLEKKKKEAEEEKNRRLAVKAVRQKLLEAEEKRGRWQKVKDYFSGKLLESEKAHPENKKVVASKSPAKDDTKTTRQEQVEGDLKKAGLSDEQINKLKGK